MVKIKAGMTCVMPLRKLEIYNEAQNKNHKAGGQTFDINDR